jgi:peptidoglycan hydrolase CwlO-like protein
MKKIIWLIILVSITYITLIFVKPVIADKIAKMLWIENINEEIIEIKDKLDYFSTKIPSKEELENAYSWAKDKISKLKDNIDDIRETANNLENKYNKAVDFIDETWKNIEKVNKVIGDLQEVWKNIENIINNWVAQ